MVDDALTAEPVATIYNHTTASLLSLVRVMRLYVEEDILGRSIKGNTNILSKKPWLTGFMFQLTNTERWKVKKNVKLVVDTTYPAVSFETVLNQCEVFPSCQIIGLSEKDLSVEGGGSGCLLALVSGRTNADSFGMVCSIKLLD